MSDESNETTNGETPVGAKNETNTQESDDFVSREDFNQVYKENMKRKAKIAEYESELAELREKSGTVEKVSEDVMKYKKLLEEKDRAITELKYKTALSNKLSKFEPLNGRVADLAFQDAMQAGVLEDEKELDQFLKMWKKENSTLFKADSTLATSPQQKQKVETQAVDVNPLEEMDQLTRNERQRLPKGKYEAMMEALRNQAYNK